MVVKKTFTLEDLEKRAKVIANKRNREMLERYHLAKSLGFNSIEAEILSSRSIKVIKELAQQRKVKPQP